MKNKIQECLEWGIPTRALRDAYRSWLAGWDGQCPPPGDESLKKQWSLTRGGDIPDNQTLAEALQQAYELNFSTKKKEERPPKRKGNSYSNIKKAIYGGLPVEIREVYDKWEKGWQGDCPEIHDDFEQYLFVELDIDPNLYSHFLIQAMQEAYELPFELDYLRREVAEYQQLKSHLKAALNILNPPKEEV